MRQFSLIFAAALLMQIAPHALAAVSDLDLRTMRSDLNIDQDRWIQNAEQQLPAWWSQSLLQKAKKQEKEGQYQEALVDLLRVDKLVPNIDVNMQLALCYAHLQRKSEALALMDKLPDQNWTVKAEIYSTLGMYQEALAACQDPTMLFAQPVMYKASLLNAHGDREAAIKILKEQYWHMVRTDEDTDKIENALKQLGVELTPPPEIKTFNKRLAIFLDRLPKLQPPTNAAELERIFERTFVVQTKNGEGQNEKYLNAEAPRDGANKFSYVRFTHDDNSPSILLNVQVGLESTFITIGEVRKILSNEGVDSFTEQIIPPSLCDHCTGRPRGGGVQLNCAYKEQQLEFFFVKSGQLSTIQKGWSRSADEIKEYRLANIPEPVFRASNLDAIEAKLQHSEFQDAALQILKTWKSVDSTKLDRADILKLRYRKRDLLARCYVGMKKEDIAAYLKAAPLTHIDGLAGAYKYLPIDKIFPTYAEYIKVKWLVTGNSSTPDGGFYIAPCGTSFCVYPTSPLFQKFFAIIGPMVAHDEKRVPPLPASLIDDYLFESGM